MNPEPNPSDAARRTQDDEQLAALVRAVADDWRMPPQRLDVPTWRERVRTASIGRRPWMTRVALPAGAAAVATVVLAVAAVWLTSRGGNVAVGTSPLPSLSTSPSPTGTPSPSPLPKVLRNGPLPSVTRVIVRAEGDTRLADLANGEVLTSTLRPFTSESSVVPVPDGGWLCLCVKWISVGANGPTDLALSLATVDADGRVGAERSIREVRGTIDPNQRADRQYQVADAASAVSADGATAYLSWSEKHGATGWTAGVDTIDIATQAVVDSQAFELGQPAVPDGSPVTRNAPTVRVAPAGDRVFLSGFWYVESPNDPNPPAGTDHWTATIDGRSIGTPTSLPSTSTADCWEQDTGAIDSGSYYVVCAEAGDLVVRRVRADGSSIGETTITRAAPAVEGGALAASHGSNLYLWDPGAAVL
jgi:hypothetical protein